MTLSALLLHLLLYALTAAPAATPGVAPACEVSGATHSAGDVTRAVRACQVARERFGVLLGSPVPEVSVVLTEEPGYRTGVRGPRAMIYWPTTQALAAAAGGDPAGPYGADPWDEVLPHEIAHVLLAARFFGSGPGVSAGPGGYGTPFPDWLDEAAAIWVEPAASRAARLHEARSLPESRRGLSAILSARHPGATDPAVMAMRDGALPPSDASLEAFYPQSIALLGFVFDRGGRTAVRMLADHLRTDPDAGVDALLALPGLPSAPATLEAEWIRWLERESHRSAAAR